MEALNKYDMSPSYLSFILGEALKDFRACDVSWFPEKPTTSYTCHQLLGSVQKYLGNAGMAWEHMVKNIVNFIEAEVC